MPPSRRLVLRVTALSLAGVGGCSTADVPSTETDRSPAPTHSPPATASTDTTATAPTDTAGDETDTPEQAAPVSCGPGPLPGAGWPLPDRSTGRTNYAPAAGGPPASPTAAWTATAPEPEVGTVFYTRPVVADGDVYVGRRIAVGPEQPLPDRQYVDAYDAATGDRRWQAPVAGEPETPVVAGGTVLVHDDRDTLYAFDAATGVERWTYEPPGRVAGILPATAGILVASYGTVPENELLALDPNGRPRWRVRLPARTTSQLAAVDRRAYVVTRDAVLVAVDVDARAVAWRRNLQDGDDTAPTTLVATQCAVFVAVDGVLYAVDPGGTVAWTVDGPVRKLATDGETIFGLAGDGTVRSVRAADGTQCWNQFYGFEDIHRTDGFYEEPAVDAGTLYAGCLNGKLVALSTEDGAEQWTLDPDWPSVARVTVVDDTLYTAWGNRLVAFR